MNMDIEVFEKLIKTIRETIEFLEANDTDNADLDELKLLLSDNLSKEGKIHIRPSLLNTETRSLLFLKLYGLLGMKKNAYVIK